MEFFSESDATYKNNYEILEQVGSGMFPMTPVISIDKANNLLRERGKVVYVQEHESGAHISFKEKYGGCSDNYKALLICVEETEKDSVEKIISEMIRLQEQCRGPSEYLIDPSDHSVFGKLAQRARKILGEK